MRVCLYFGSFNPFHIGHYKLARYMMQTYHFDKLLFVLSPLNPLKQSSSMLPFSLRYDFLKASLFGDEGVEVCTLERLLPEPHYTVRSLQALRLLMPQAEFSMLIGADNLHILKRWYAYERLSDFTDLYVYPREGYEDFELDFKAKIHFCQDAPRIDVSSTMLREALAEGNDLSHLIPNPSLWSMLHF